MNIRNYICDKLSLRSRSVVLEPIKKTRGSVLLSYIDSPFKHGTNLQRHRGHTNAYECVEIANSYLELGYSVEIIDYNNKNYIPSKDTEVAIDIHSNLERWAPLLPKDCIKVLHATGAHWLTGNAAEFTRLRGVYERRGVSLKPYRQMEPSKAIETCDLASIIGNVWTMGTFSYAKKPLHRVRLSSAYLYDWDRSRNFESSRRSFVWLGSYGMVLKGLDLVLEAFAKMPDYFLTICGRPEKEPDFYNEYKKELLELPNIKHVGWMDLHSQEFNEIRRTHAGVIYPSSYEGCAGSVVHCVHAGLVPILTEETGFDLGHFGNRVEGGTVDAVCKAVREFATTVPSTIEQKARAAWEFARNEHTQERFSREYRHLAKKISEMN